MAEFIEIVGIIGIARMDTGIAYEALLGSFRVLLRDVSDEQVRTGLAGIVGHAEADYRADKLSRLESDVIVSRVDAVIGDQHHRFPLRV